MKPKIPVTIRFLSALTLEPVMFLQFDYDKKNIEYLHTLMQLLVDHFPGQVKIAKENALLLAVSEDMNFMITFCYYCMLTLGIKLAIADNEFAYEQYNGIESKSLEGTILEFRKKEKLKWDQERKLYGDLAQIQQDVKKYEEEELEEQEQEFQHGDDDDGLAYSGR